MHFKFTAAAALAGLFLLAPAATEASCCDQMAGHETAACCDQPCCNETKAAEPSAIDLFVTMDPQAMPTPPARQTTEVWLQRPTLVGRSILQGRYVIEHDNDRMARGEPCTHIYAFSNRNNPVVTFHCTHLERDASSRNVVVLASTADAGMQKLMEFQFAGEAFAHGYPQGR